MRARASRASESATSASTMPPPTAIVSVACASALSPSATAAAMPPWAQAVDAPSPSGAAEIRVTGRGASFSAQNSPASPPPTMTTSSVLRVRSWMLSDMIISSGHPRFIFVVPATRLRQRFAGLAVVGRRSFSEGGRRAPITTGGNCFAKLCAIFLRDHNVPGSWVLDRASLVRDDIVVSILQVDHPLDRAPRFRGDRRIDRDFLAKREQAVQDLGQRDPLHVRTEVAWPHHLDVGQLGLHIVRHRAFGDHHHPLADRKSVV